MKKILLMAVVAIMATNVFAQETVKKVRVYKGEIIAYEEKYADVDSIVFVDVAKPIVIPTGAISGKFTINENGDQVYFSQGNLQYQASTNTWRFAESQYDYIGNDNSKISSTYTGWIDLFGWGTSGYDNTPNDPFAINYQPWARNDSELNQQCTIEDEIYNSSDVNRYGYGPSTFMTDANLTGTSAKYDWGIYNVISNGGNKADQWRTLTYAEWVYIFNSRNTAQHLRSLATVCDVHGYIVLPDDFTLPDGLSWNYQANDWETNTYDAQAWSDMEAAGAVFLPTAGNRGGSYIRQLGSQGNYWSASYFDQFYAYRMVYGTGGALMGYGVRSLGCSVRLVQDVK